MLQTCAPRAKTLDDLFRLCENYSLDAEIEAAEQRIRLWDRTHPKINPEPKPPTRPNPYVSVTIGLARTPIRGPNGNWIEEGPPPGRWTVETSWLLSAFMARQEWDWFQRNAKRGCRMGVEWRLEDHCVRFWVATPIPPDPFASHLSWCRLNQEASPSQVFVSGLYSENKYREAIDEWKCTCRACDPIP
jgi:hypothetical protein